MRALISVSDKTNIVEFGKTLNDHGYEIISTGGTFAILKEAGLNVIQIDQVTQFPEMMNGRVKTLHPKIHGGLLALRDNDEHQDACKKHDIHAIDIVVVNLYPFEATIQKDDCTLENAIENIDIGGPSMIRSAAKNHRSVTVVVNPDHYQKVSAELDNNNGQVSLETRQQLAVEAYDHTASYDRMISTYLAKQYNSPIASENLHLSAGNGTTLRYGENPHQAASFFTFKNAKGLAAIEQLHGKELSYNNIVDLEAAWLIAREFDANEPVVTIIKHTNPCGTAVGNTLKEAYQTALDADPVSAFGSIIAMNQTVDKDTAEELSNLFVEAIIAPDFSTEALDILTQKPSIRLIKHPDFYGELEPTIKHVQGGLLQQDANNILVDPTTLNTITETKPSDQEEKDLMMAFKVCKHVKSNAIVIAKNGKTIGVGAGQMSRIEAAEIALKKAGDDAKGAVLASDAFFPFRDCVDLSAKFGISAIIQPGGSKRDDESVDACNEHGISMIMTGIRHFKH